MRKLLIVLLVVSIFIISCTPAQGPPPKTLNDLQITACKAAHDAGTCDTRLPEVGIVLKEECCKNLGKCCA